jgi:hypothetical protein
MMFDPVDWFVIFPAPRQPPRWWQRALHPAYRHCLALRADGDDRSLVIDHIAAGLQVDTVYLPAPQLLAQMQTALTAAVLLVPPGQAQRARPCLLRPSMSCVEVVKAALGIAAPWVITPRQLAQHLRRHYAATPILPLTSGARA